MTAANVEQLYTGCLAQAAYFIESAGEAAVVDPLRDPAPYVELAAKKDAKIKYVVLTHFHADFVGGQCDLAAATGATIVYGPNAAPAYDAHICRDGEALPLGKHTLTALHTPGHTMESTTFLLAKDDGTPHCIFTGDTLFIGDAGRPDLAQKAASMTQEELAGLLFTSLRTKIMPLPDDVIVYPGHGAGSACGKNMSSETFDTLGKQKLTNYTLRADATKEEFVAELIDGLRAPPGYFGTQVAMNKGEVAADVTFAGVLAKGRKELTPDEVEAAIAAGTLVFDCRPTPKGFCDGHVPKTVFAGTVGNLAVWAATVFADVQQPFAVVANDDNLTEAISRLARVGFNNCLGHLKGGVAAWTAAGKPFATIESLSATEVAALLEKDAAAVQVVDVRGPGEFRNAHLDGATHSPLCSRDKIDHAAIVQEGKRVVAHCAGGYRSVMWISVARRAGVDTVANIEGGWGAMAAVPQLQAKTVSRE